MRKWRIVIGLAVVASMLVGASAASAGPPGGPDLDGLSFAVTVENVDGFPGAPETFVNCYSFDGKEWNDPGFPLPGTFTATTAGPLTHYNAGAAAGPVVIEQTGFVTQSFNLHAKTVLTLPDGSEFRFVSNGHAADC